MTEDRHDVIEVIGDQDHGRAVGHPAQAENDTVWNDFNKAQYEPVMEKARPLLEHKEPGESEI
jgi:hypothetical protein